MAGGEHGINRQYLSESSVCVCCVCMHVRGWVWWVGVVGG